MATVNPFDLLGDNDYEDPSLLVAAQPTKVVEKPKKPSSTPAQAQPANKAAAKFPSKPAPPSQAVRDSRTEGGRGGGRGGGGRGYGRGGGRSYDRDLSHNDAPGSNNGFSGGFSGGYKPSEEGEAGKLSERRGGGYGAPRGSFRGGRRGGFDNGESRDGERPRRQFERRSGTGRGGDFKREGAGRGNWGTPTDEIAPETEELVADREKNPASEKLTGEEEAVDANKENPVNEEEKEPENKEMTLEEYEKVLEEKRKALLALKTEERKVDADKEFKSMQPLSSKKKNSDDIFIKLGSEKDKRKEAAEKEERAKKAVSINEFLKPAEGERFYNPGGRGRGRGRGSRGGFGGNNPSYNNAAAAPAIEDVGQFPSLGGK